MQYNCTIEATNPWGDVLYFLHPTDKEMRILEARARKGELTNLKMNRGKIQ